MKEAVEALKRAIEFLDAARADPSGVETGAMRDAREWLEEAARAVVKEQHQQAIITEYYQNRRRTHQAP